MFNVRMKRATAELIRSVYSSLKIKDYKNKSNGKLKLLIISGKESEHSHGQRRINWVTDTVSLSNQRLPQYVVFAKHL
jgi:hypothetical protein